jgi:hypothetical protein
MSQQSNNCAIAVIGIDIGKNSFHVVGHDHAPFATDDAWRCDMSRRAKSRLSAAEGLASYSITSSAVASNVCGMVSRSASAVFRLTTISNLVGNWTGRSAGFSPFKIRSTYPAARR